MKTRFWMFLLMIALIIFSTAITFAELISDNSDSKIQLLEGENQVLIPEDVSPFYVKDLTMAYPEILTVTYFQFEEEKGYVNIFGGIGDNFIIYANTTYNITVSKTLEVNLK